MNIDPAFVTTQHEMRLFVVMFIVPVVLSYLGEASWHI